ncbi:hypothetical protein BS50DRAFT_640479 [Corynespora cassiicola Philippines]|uniref:Secreted protein n=1 Tax=Corynespora cassiicola Philippines TaxID=1448308 RepID=A0A2T2N486_CORCC|nr:hypothetical protein BS50DRAFT_640479 [Corynespora cassiicola Philippines]
MHLKNIIASTFLVVAVSSAPTEEKKILEVIPGEGLPSLESLGLTAEYLYSLPAPTTPVPRSPLEKRVILCQSNNCAVDDAIACYHYLRNLGRQNCVVNRDSTFCTAGGCKITGKSVLTESSWCEHVAVGVLAVIDGCTNTAGRTGGRDVAYGNGNLLVDTLRR